MKNHHDELTEALVLVLDSSLRDYFEKHMKPPQQQNAFKNPKQQAYLEYKNSEYADHAEEFYYETLKENLIGFSLGRPLRVAFYNRYRVGVDPLYTDKLTEIAKLWLPRIGSLERIIIEKEPSWKEYEKLDAGDYDLIVTPDLHQFGDTVQEALDRITRLNTLVYFDLESMLSDDADSHFLTLRLLMSEETAGKELLREERPYFFERQKGNEGSISF